MPWCRWHHAGFCSATGQITSAKSLQRWPTFSNCDTAAKLTVIFNKDISLSMILVYSICRKNLRRKMIVLDFDVLGIMSHHQPWLGVGGAQTSQGWGAQMRTGPWHGAAAHNTRDLRRDGSIKILPTSRNCPVIPRIILTFQRTSWVGSYEKFCVRYAHYAIILSAEVFCAWILYFGFGLGIEEWILKTNVVMTHEKAIAWTQSQVKRTTYILISLKLTNFFQYQIIRWS